ncbi:hypothetical protein Mapa_010966 [Marchantia paleacea]|nr:hypothetical protein Mapa_010966 [Marchantia paleacea]
MTKDHQPKMVNIQRSKNDPPSNEMMETLLTFTIGQEVESKSHAQGYRGAWFRCKIEDIDRGGRGQLRFKLRYLNFPDEALHWSQAYQQRQRGNAATFELMLRPPMPPIITEEDLPDVMFDGLVVVVRAWEVGDLVNFWCDDVWWECYVSEIVDQETVKVSLFKPPHGEGGQHSVKGRALRPSLSWTLADGWSVPALKKNSHGRPCSRLVRLSSRLLEKVDSPLKRDRGIYVDFGDSPDVIAHHSVQDLQNQFPATIKVEDQSFPFLSPGETQMKVKTVPNLSALRSAVEPLIHGDDEDSGKDADSDVSDRETSEAAELQRLRVMESKRRSQKKIEKYRKQVQRNIRLARIFSTNKHKLRKVLLGRSTGKGRWSAYLHHRAKVVKLDGQCPRL